MRSAWLVALVGASAFVAACAPEPFTLVVTVRGPELVVYRDGDGDWTPVEPALSGKARIRIESGRYSLVWVCGTSEWHVIHSTLADEPAAVCGGGLAPAAVALSGTASQRAEIYVGASSTSADPESGRYFVDVDAGYHDVLALSGEDAPRQVVLEHDVDLRSSRELDLFGGTALEAVEPLITGSPQAITLASKLYTRNGGAFSLPTLGEVAYVVPPNLLVETDWQVVQADSETRCSSSVRVDSSDLHIEVPDRPEPRVDARRVSWTSDVEWRYVRVALNQRIFVSATRDWMEAQDVTDVEIPDLARLPGVDGQLGLDPDDPLGWTFYVERGHRSSTFASCSVDSDF